MSVITIPKGLNQKEKLIAVPQTTYEDFLAWQKKMKSARTFKPTVADKRALARARTNFSHGNYVTIEQLRHELDIDR
ncbi:MAG: hypothetical protein AAB916_02720 [Patescibacteria group bacterium]